MGGFLGGDSLRERASRGSEIGIWQWTGCACWPRFHCACWHSPSLCLRSTRPRPRRRGRRSPLRPRCCPFCPRFSFGAALAWHPSHSLSRLQGKQVQGLKQTQGLQALELAHVKKCARDITGSDKPRKLPPAQAKAVNECAKKFMPPPHTKAMLEAAARKVLAANHMKTDAQSVKKLMSAHKPAASAKTVGAAASRASAKVRLQHKAAKAVAAKH